MHTHKAHLRFPISIVTPYQSLRWATDEAERQAGAVSCQRQGRSRCPSDPQVFGR